MKNREIFRKFFKENKEWINNHNLLNTNNLKVFYDMYEKFIKDNNYNDEELNNFRIVIKNEILRSLERKDLITIVMNFRKDPSSSYVYINNPTINEWYLSSRVNYVVEKADLMVLNSVIEPNIKQNRYERYASFNDAAKKKNR